MTDPGPRGLTSPQGNHLIPLADAAAMTARFRSRNPGEVRAWLFDRRAFDALMAQTGCAGIRIYRAVKEDGSDQLVVVGTDTTGNDLAPASSSGDGLVMEWGWPCPPLCGAPSALGG